MSKMVDGMYGGIDISEQWLDYEIKRSRPSDIVKLTWQEDDFLQDLWVMDGVEDVAVPSDIVISNTIPLADCVIEVDERELEKGRLIQYRVVIFEDVVKDVSNLLEHGDDCPLIIGALIPLDPYTPKLFEYILLMLSKDNNGIGLVPTAKNELGKRILKQRPDALRGIYGYLITWYSIQIALLHPDVKEAFKNPSRQIANAGTGKGERQRKARYIRKHILKLDELENAAHTNEARKYNRRCLVWYVIGHWREYPNGKRVFIKPYWKGVLRQTKRNADGDDRIRIIRKEQTVCMN